MPTQSPGRPVGLIRRAWEFLRLASGDDAYDRYLAHWEAHHREQGPPLDRGAFHAAELRRRWDGIRRCC